MLASPSRRRLKRCAGRHAGENCPVAFNPCIPPCIPPCEDPAEQMRAAIRIALEWRAAEHARKTRGEA